MEVSDIQSFLKYYARVKSRTRRLFDYIPKGKTEWTYKKGKFTIGDIIRHLANTERHMYAESAQFRSNSYQGCGTKYAKGKKAVIQYYDDMFEESIAIFSKLTPEDLNKKCGTPGGIQITLWKWLRAMVEHEIHHRGQLYTYLGMLGIEVPPLYGLTSEQVIQQSRNNKITESKKEDLPFNVLYFLKGKEHSLIEIKRTDIESEDKSKIYFWFLFDKKNQKLEQLYFMSMHSTGEVEEREFTQGKLVFDLETGQFFEPFGSRFLLKNKTSKKLPKKIRNAILELLKIK